MKEGGEKEVVEEWDEKDVEDKEGRRERKLLDDEEEEEEERWN